MEILESLVINMRNMWVVELLRELDESDMGKRTLVYLAIYNYKTTMKEKANANTSDREPLGVESDNEDSGFGYHCKIYTGSKFVGSSRCVRITDQLVSVPGLVAPILDEQLEERVDGVYLLKAEDATIILSPGVPKDSFEEASVGIEEQRMLFDRLCKLRPKYDFKMYDDFLKESSRPK